MVERKEKMKKMMICMLKGLLAGMLVTIMLIALLAVLLYRWNVGQNVQEIGVIVIYILSTFLAGYGCAKGMKQRRFFWGMLEGGLYFIVVCIFSILMRGNDAMMLQSVISAFFICVGSGVLGGILA